ncbi:hypothetical protein LIPSTDRAFT_101886 [Lipomyces starkeyi NRRL Y-11557]|uniref:Uncharacterized protein n=1 Tax=Lipomyces starkeyi NRRL Y-11557 TaxID=675824 RepID=A0A1E3QG99_LIPST|nr:hypothetical protein LIPSTDRAFT_101886 [Lipomyces starkeyi NRRL Y-11557]
MGNKCPTANCEIKFCANLEMLRNFAQNAIYNVRKETLDALLSNRLFNGLYIYLFTLVNFRFLLFIKPPWLNFKACLLKVELTSPEPFNSRIGVEEHELFWR